MGWPAKCHSQKTVWLLQVMVVMTLVVATMVLLVMRVVIFSSTALRDL